MDLRFSFLDFIFDGCGMPRTVLNTSIQNLLSPITMQSSSSVDVNTATDTRLTEVSKHFDLVPYLVHNRLNADIRPCLLLQSSWITIHRPSHAVLALQSHYSKQEGLQACQIDQAVPNLHCRPMVLSLLAALMQTASDQWQKLEHLVLCLYASRCSVSQLNHVSSSCLSKA